VIMLDIKMATTIETHEIGTILIRLYHTWHYSEDQLHKFIIAVAAFKRQLM
jgi:hypothetical protein